MIPQVAYFYWTGGPLPWLRAQSMATFSRHHPGWRTVLGSPDLEEAPDGVELERDTVTDPRLPPAARSDVWRYSALRRGGVYADTDCLFLGSIDSLLAGDHDAWITQDGGTDFPGAKGERRIENGKKFYTRPPGVSIGLLAASEGSQFLSRAYELASGRPPGPDYQSHGSRLLVDNWAELTRGLSLGPIPFASLYTGSSAEDVRRLWRPGPRPKGPVLHWYGGSPESVPWMSAESVGDLPESVVRSALS